MKFGGWGKFGGCSKFGGGRPFWERYYYLAKSMLLPGAWPQDDDDPLNRLLRSICFGLGHIAIHAELAWREIFPHLAAATLDEWEALLKVTHKTGQDQATRRAAMLSRWRGAAGASLPEMREALHPLLNSTTAFRDDFDDETVSHRWIDSGNGTKAEAAGVLTLTATAATDCRMDGTNILGNMLRRRVHDISDDFTATLDASAKTVTANAGAGIILFQDFQNWSALIFESTFARVINVRGGVETNPASATAIAVPCYLQIEKVVGELVFRHGDSTAVAGVKPSTDGLTEIGRYDVDGLITRDVGLFARNDGTDQSVLGALSFKLVHATPHNNVEIIETRIAQIDAASGDAEDIFRGFIHRDPSDSGEYDLDNARRLLDRNKQGHTVWTVGESDCFRCDDPNSLTDRDILGS